MGLSYWASREISRRGWDLKLWLKEGMLGAESEKWANGQMGISHQLSPKMLCPVTQSSPAAGRIIPDSNFAFHMTIGE